MLHLPIVILYQQIDKVEKRKQRISHSIDGRTIETITPKKNGSLTGSNQGRNLDAFQRLRYEKERFRESLTTKGKGEGGDHGTWEGGWSIIVDAHRID